MKIKIITTLIIGLLFNSNAEAQFLKKLKDRAAEAAERTILNKTDEKVSKKTGKTIDDATEGGKNKKSNEIEETDKNSGKELSEEEKQANEKKMGNFFGGGLEGVPDIYTFSYALTYEITSGKDTNALEYLLEPNVAYFGNKLDDQKLDQIIVLDLKKNLMVTFMNNDQQKTAMKMRMPNLQKVEKKFGKKLFSEEEDDVDIVQIEGKTILGYRCNGFQVNSEDGIVKFWVTNDAPVSLNGVYANFSSLPKSVKDKGLPLNEKSLVMEMLYTSHKKKKDNMLMVCTELKENSLELHKKDYKAGM